MNLLSKFKKGFLILVLTLSIVSGLAFINPQPAKAIIVEDFVNLAVNIKDTVWKLASSAIEHSASILFKNTTKYFLNNLAYNAATAIVEGGTGKTPLFPKLQPGDLLKQAAGDALGEFIDGVIGEAGLQNFDICNPGSLQTTINILIPSFREIDPNAFTKDSPYQAKCHWQDIKKNWTEFKDAATKDPSKYLLGIKAQFKDGANDLDITTKIQSRLLDNQQESKAAAQLNVIANQYINPVVSPISKFIKTPASVVSGSFQNTIDKSTTAETTFTGDLFADALGIFTNTLAAKLQKKIMNGLDNNSLPTSKVTLQQLNSLSGITKNKGDQFADFRTVNAVRADGGSMNAFEKFSSERLPMQGDNSLTKGPGATSEVLPDFVLVAARQELTVKQAISQGIIPGNIQFGFSKQKPLKEKVSDDYVDTDIKNDDGNWSSGLSYRGLLIGRTQRVFPQSWELAALYWRYYDDGSTGPLTLQTAIDCFADTNPGISPYGTRYSEDPRYPEKCRRDMNGNGTTDDLNPMEDYNPYFHLVDPNWVLKLPSTKCLAKGPGSELSYESIQCSEDNVDAGSSAIPGGASNGGTAISRGEGTPICDADQAKKLSINTDAGINYDIPTKTVTREDNYCADWQSCVKEDNNGKCTAYGYCVEETPVTKLNADSCSFPVDSNNGLYSSCDNFQIAGQQYNLLKNTLKRCNDTDAGCKQYSTNMKPNTDGSLAWDFSVTNSSVFLNNNAKECDKTNDGCTKVVAYKTGVNLVYNGNFSTAKLGVTSPSGWKIEKEEGANCEFIQKFNGEAGASLVSDGVGGCAVVNETPFLMSTGYDYSLKFKVKTENGNKVDIRVSGVDESGITVKTETISAIGSADWKTIENKLSVGADATQSWVFPLSTRGLTVKFVHNQQSGKVGINEVELDIINGPLVDVADIGNSNTNYQEDYTRRNLESYKLPPQYLGCELYYQKLGNFNQAQCQTNHGVWNEKMKMCAVGGRQECDNFAPLCSAQDVGCQLFKSTDGSASVPAKVSGDDICPNECINYDSYSRQPSFFEANEFPSMYTTAASCQEAGGSWDAGKNACVAQPRYVNLIPSTANQCVAEAVGCQSFTNLSAASTGGEKNEYFSFLRPCVTETATSISKVFYTWEGSDTSGYQLKKWTRLVSNLGTGPCTNVDADTGACLDTGNGGVWNSNTTANNIGNRALCNQTNLIDNPDCRDFFDINDKHYYILQSKSVSARQPKSPDACVSYRNDLTGKVYNADPADAVRCQAAEVGCRAFKGGTSNNIRTVFESKFEDGTLGGWKNSGLGIGGLTIYNDALRQGESSMLVNVTNDTVSYKTDNKFIDTGKEYTLVILAKKVDTPQINKTMPDNLAAKIDTKGFVQKVLAQSLQEPIVFTYQGNLQNEWREYRIGPITASNVLDNQINIKIKNLGNNESFAIDEVRLLEGRDIYYLIDKTWETPLSCDNPINNLEGCDASGQNCGQRTAEGAQLGCRAYLDKKNNSVAIKAFTQLCSSSAVDCQAFINTANSDEPSAFEKTTVCDATNGTIKNDICLMGGIEVCKLNGGQSCDYSIASVAADKLIYFSPDETKSCNQQFAGCMAVGKPGYDLTEVPAKIEKFETKYLLNNPNQYNSILCSGSGLMCEIMVASDGSQGVYVSPIGANEKTSRLCVYDSGKNRWVEKADPEKNCEIDNPVAVGNRSKYMTTADNQNYRGWVGMCESSYVGCNEYRNPEKSSTAGANWCDATVNASDYGICDTNNGVDVLYTAPSDGKKFCQKKISGLDHLVCELLNGETKCNYTATDWICYGQEKMDKGRDENGVCQINGNDVCVIKSNSNGVKDTLSCSYSPLCVSAYAISSSVKQCSGGQVDRSAGCAPFYDVNSNTVSGAAKATKDNGVLVTCDENAKPGEDKYCNTNVVLENRLTRQCSEWLYCTSGAKVGDKNVCFDVGRCAEADAQGKCIKPSTKTNINVKNQTYDFKNIFDRENVRYSTGYSRTGLSWTPDKTIEGFASPESMKQNSNFSTLDNADFETIPMSGSIKGWQVVGDGQNCPIGNLTDLFDGKNAWDGYYSLKLAKPGDAGFCTLTSNSGSGQDGNNNFYLPFNSRRTYVLSFAAKSSTGDQAAAAGLSFFDSDYNVCSIVTNDLNNAVPAAARSKYTAIGTYENQTMYYNRYCIDKNGSTTLTETPSWIWGYQVKMTKIRKDWQNYTVAFDTNSADPNKSVPVNASYAKVVIFGPHPGWGGIVGASGTIWLDDIKLDSSLQISENKYVSSMCRLYPSADAKQCSYSKLNREYKGWNGYCLEEDPFVPGQCLQWYPVDSVGGDNLNGDEEQLQAYDNRSSLYMCVASSGAYKRNISLDSLTVWWNENSMPSNICVESLGAMSLKGADPNAFNSLKSSVSLGDVAYIKLWTESASAWPYGICDNNYWNELHKTAFNLIRGYWLDGTIKKPALWWGGGYSEGANPKKYKENSASDWGEQNWSDWWSQSGNAGCAWGSECNKGGVGVLFNEDGSLNDVLWFVQDGSANSGSLNFRELGFYLKDDCRLMAKVVNDNGDNKVVQSTYNGNWLTNNPMGYSKTTPGSPFGSLILNNGLSTVEPNNWSENYVPFNFETNNVGMPLYSLRKVDAGEGAAYCQLTSASEEGMDLKCQGSKTSDPTRMCSFCAGVGKYKYSGLDNAFMTSARCDVDGASDPNCLPPKELHPSSIGNFEPASNVYETGINRLKNLFAKVYGWYEFSTVAGRSVYKKITDNPNFYTDYSDQGSSGVISNIKIGDRTSGNIAVDAPGESMPVTFKVDIPNEQLPIRTLVIDWGDGTQPTEFSGEFNERNSDGNPFTFSHWYGCIPTADGNRCRACTKPNTLPGVDGSCTYDVPKIKAQDNWGWCAVAVTDNKRLMSNYSANVDSSICSSIPYNANNGKIIVKPRQ